MNRKSIKFIVSLVIILVVSCGDPETVVTNYVHPDGSVTRKIEMKSVEADKNKRFKASDIQVPLDSTWKVTDSCEVNKKGDTTWVKRAEKHFRNIDEINLAYKSDSGANRSASRHAGFEKRFKWFNTEFRFSEKIDRKFSYGYPVKDFLNSEEVHYFYSPERLKHEQETGSDSLKYKALSDTINAKTGEWTTRCFISEWIGEFVNLTTGKGGSDISQESLKAREKDLLKIVEENDKKFDSLWANGVILKKFIGEANAIKFKKEADSAYESVTKNFLADFKNYSVRIVMPGKLIGTNGFIDGSNVLLWPVESDYFLTEQYEMWAESKVPNSWAWIVSGLFLIFVITGVIRRVIKKD
jgi:hypothetical protein